MLNALPFTLNTMFNKLPFSPNSLKIFVISFIAMFIMTFLQSIGVRLTWVSQIRQQVTRIFSAPKKPAILTTAKLRIEQPINQKL